MEPKSADQQRENKQMLAITTLFCLSPIAAGLILWNRLPEQLPTQLGPGGYSSRTLVVFLVPLAMAVINYYMHNAEHKAKSSDMKLSRTLRLWAVPMVTVMLESLILLRGIGYQIDIDLVLQCASGLLLVLLGIYLRSCKQSRRSGLRTPWAMDSNENWKRTHALASVLFMIAGLVMIFVPAVGQMEAVLLILGGIVAVSYLYSYILYKLGV